MNTNFERYHQSVISGIILIQVVSFDIINDSFYGSYLQASPTSPQGMDCLSFHSKSLSSFLKYALRSFQAATVATTHQVCID